jgi:hypothetical protein
VAAGMLCPSGGCSTGLADEPECLGSPEQAWLVDARLTPRLRFAGPRARDSVAAVHCAACAAAFSFAPEAPAPAWRSVREIGSEWRPLGVSAAAASHIAAPEMERQAKTRLALSAASQL